MTEKVGGEPGGVVGRVGTWTTSLELTNLTVAADPLTTPHWALNDTRTPFYRIPRSVPSVLGFLVLGLHNFGRRVLS